MQSLWHEFTIQLLPTQQLLHLHRVLCKMRGKSLGKVGPAYVWRSPYRFLHRYHLCVISEMSARGWKPNRSWNDILYRGKNCAAMTDAELFPAVAIGHTFPEHTAKHLDACLERLKACKKSAKDAERIKRLTGRDL